jgi:ribonuclease HI
MAHKVTIYTDGAARGNPGPGGYGVVLISGKRRLELSEGYRLTTNNRMELMAVIVGLEALKISGLEVVIYTDSRYVADAVEQGWVFRWESKFFKKKKNADLWMRFLRIYRNHKIKFVWIKGHASNPENEYCDRLAVEASEKKRLLEDTGYSPESGNNNLFQDQQDVK